MSEDHMDQLRKIAEESTKVELDVLELLKSKYSEATVNAVVMPLITLAVLLLARSGFTPQQTLHFLEAGFTSASMRVAMEAKKNES
jgi:hypothetical protein